MCKVDPLGLLCLELEAEEELPAAFNDEQEGDEAGGLVTGS